MISSSANVHHSQHKKNLIKHSGKQLPSLQQALAFHQKGQLTQAEAIYSEILQSQPKHFDALHLLGVIAFQTKNYQRAVELIDKAIAIYPNRAAFYSSLGNALQGLKQFDAAVANYDQAIRLKPDFADAYSNRGNALQELKQFDAALASYDQAIRLKPDYADAYWNKSLGLLLNGDLENGWQLYEWRWEKEDVSKYKRNFSQPLWLGVEAL